MNTKKYLILGLLVLLVFTQCTRESLNVPVEKNSNKPGPVTNISVTENSNGQSTITYTLPPDEDLLYVKAEYEIRPGVKREVVTSYYTNTMVLDGFSKAGAYDVKLYAITRSQISSDPATVTVNPLESPVNLSFQNLAIQASFGGPNIRTKNAARQPIVIVPLIDTTGNGNYYSLNKIYTQTDSINITIRGLRDRLTKFAFYITDKYGNRSDTLYSELTPFAEIRLDKTKFSGYPLPGDAVLAYQGEGVRYGLLWDNNYNLNGIWPRFYTVTTDLNPQTITWNIGVRRKLSRIVFFSRSENQLRYYEQGNLRDFEVWGSANPNPDGSYDASWVKLATKSLVRPSGLAPGSASTAEDAAYAIAGWEVEFDPSAPSVQYLRVRSLRNWENTTWITMSQLDVYGSDK